VRTSAISRTTACFAGDRQGQGQGAAQQEALNWALSWQRRRRHALDAAATAEAIKTSATTRPIAAIQALCLVTMFHCENLHYT
jgi:hypothetical protein